MEEGIYEIKFRNERKLKPLINSRIIPKYFAFYSDFNKLKTIHLSLIKSGRFFYPDVVFPGTENMPLSKYNELDFLVGPSKKRRKISKKFLFQ